MFQYLQYWDAITHSSHNWSGGLAMPQRDMDISVNTVKLEYIYIYEKLSNEIKFLYSHKFVSEGQIDPNRWQTITWTNGDPLHYALLSLMLMTHLLKFCLF